ncbi:stage VI sporulation protein D [Lederbergia panacisoli]|uniref:stage VI sporulation protein D n=1 Tax=Lederbergia panacisoli TaxID=1255251 RepID=UPI00214CFFEF|nr:stage VI sporulation protein D [Lederbergia panacisoli]MCR2820561.1 stage VI sporulation protein D [Lederbergia panacisoli]
MPDRQQTSLKFPLEETVWFQKGQEVDELISISLDPNISIIDEDDYVVLKGTLELSGEFKSALGNDAMGDFPVAGRTYIEAVNIRNEGDSIFSHQFPVDITIPKRRIVNVDDMEIEIHTFDYELEENSRLKLIADIYVHGIYEEAMEIRDSFEENLDDEDQLNDLYEDEEQEEIEVDDEDAPVEVELLARSSKDDENQEDEELFEPFSVEARVLPQDGFESNEKIHFHPSIPKIPELSLETLAQRTLDFFPFQDRVESHQHYNAESPTEYYESSYESSSSIESSPEEENTVVKKKKDKYKSMSFADFFARKEDESHTKMRVRLVQQGDSIQQLADKYEVSVQQILRANRLEASHEVYEGQVLYIPAKVNSPLKKNR